MRTINLNKEQPKLKIELSESENITLTLKRVPNKIAKEFDEGIKKINEAYDKKELESIEYFYKLIDFICDGFDKEKFDEIDINAMQEISQAIIELRRPDTATEKKSE